MATEPHALSVGGIAVEVHRKAVKNLHLGVYPPDGRVRVAAPLAMSDDAVRLAVVGRLAWVKRMRAQFAAQPRQPVREMVAGESHYFRGRRRRLSVVHHDRAPAVSLRGRATIELRVRPEATAADARAALARWHRAELRKLLPPLLEAWQAKYGVAVASWGIRRMKTRWGTCHVAARRVWFNLELVKKPPRCLEYVVAHELAHLVERNHTPRFAALLDEHLPGWRATRDALNAEPLGHDEWAGK